MQPLHLVHIDSWPIFGQGAGSRALTLRAMNRASTARANVDTTNNRGTQALKVSCWVKGGVFDTQTQPIVRPERGC